MKRLLSISLLCVFLSACGGGSANTPEENDISSTELPTIVLWATFTPLPTPNSIIAFPTPTPIPPTRLATRPRPTSTPKPTPRPSATPNKAATQTKAASNAVSCPTGCATPPPGCVVKAVKSPEGSKFYYFPGVSSGYDQMVVNPANGDRWFCSEQQALRNGWLLKR